ncbi:LysM peptidoglycan-binding domain-containing protein [Blastococcus saxobsidens]|uniref:LysM peptidoglycan-binding domain-containing protein n=1 Tax=Blastococcus saxobsidens TaxID=138336 RepID=A0A6L9W0W5_9ACTN|nr:LysM peptidoglycan-binding domain-containing protein [Blastococcus saxobsidens]NEK85114.1 LysM peptidoglycan-binding domain-containing protein [Blastococcus saxobsidens]
MNPYGISVRQPVVGDLVGQRLAIAATGTAFEASYGWRLVADGSVVASDWFQAGSMGTVEAFVHEATVGTDYLGPATFELFGDDPSGQSDGLDTVSVPVISIPGATGYIPHQVAAGDTLTSIADRLGSAVERIVAANSLANPDVIQVGQLLRVPV